MSLEERLDETFSQIGDDIKDLQSNLLNPYDTSLAQDENDGSHAYYAWPRVDGTGYKAVKYSLETTNKVGEVRDVLPIPDDLTTLTYS